MEILRGPGPGRPHRPCGSWWRPGDVAAGRCGQAGRRPAVVGGRRGHLHTPAAARAEALATRRAGGRVDHQRGAELRRPPADHDPTVGLPGRDGRCRAAGWSAIGRRGSRRTGSGPGLCGHRHRARSTETPLDLVFSTSLFGVAWLVGYALRARAERSEVAEERALRAERDRESAARLAVAEERARMARELHDVVAHAVSVMVLQVGAVRHRMPATSKEGEALRNVEHAGRTALAEMRRLLGALREGDARLELTPGPGLQDLEALAKDVRAAGL